MRREAAISPPVLILQKVKSICVNRQKSELPTNEHCAGGSINLGENTGFHWCHHEHLPWRVQGRRWNAVTSHSSLEPETFCFTAQKNRLWKSHRLKTKIQPNRTRKAYSILQTSKRMKIETKKPNGRKITKGTEISIPNCPRTSSSTPNLVLGF